MRILPIFRGDDDGIFKKPDFSSDEYVQSKYTIVLPPQLTQDTFEKLKTSKGEEND